MAIQEDPSQFRTTLPSEPPRAPVSDYNESGRAVPVERGWAWIADGFQLFRKQVGIWILLVVIFFALIFAVGLVPILGGIAILLLTPVLMGGLMMGCQAIERGSELELAHLFAGFRRNTGQLMLIGLIGMGLTLAVMIPIAFIVGAGAFGAAASGEAASAASIFGGATLLGLLLAVALMIPINMALWFAPALVMLRDHSAPRAIAESFKGCLKNIVPFLIYGVILFILAIIASIPLGLGWLVLGPVAIASVYCAYRDIYLAR